MKIAYLISAFNEPKLLQKLINALNTEEAVFFVHVDKNTAVRPFKQGCSLPNVYFIPYSRRVCLTNYNQAVCQMRLIRAALDSGIEFDKLFMLSGQDQPLWSNAKIREWVDQTAGKDIISAICLDNGDVDEKEKWLYRLGRHKTDYRWTGSPFNDIASKALRRTLGSVELKNDLSFTVNGETWHLYKGKRNFAITHDTARFVYDTWQSNKEIQDYFKYSFSPSETCIHTIIFNNPEYARKALIFNSTFGSCFINDI